jgi:hypothetical protein
LAQCKKIGSPDAPANALKLKNHLPEVRRMALEIPQSARQSARLAVLALSLGVLSGCQGLIGNPSNSQVRIIDVSPGAPSLDIYQSHSALAHSLGFGTMTSYVPVTPGTYTIAANSAGTEQVISAAKGTFLPAAQYTVLIGGDIAAHPRQFTLKDQNQPAPPGQIALRFIGQAVRIGAVDIYLVPPGQTLADAKPVVTNMNLGANTGYRNIPTGTYTIIMLPAGTIPTGATLPAYTGAQVDYTDGSARTMILIDQLLVSGYHLQVITADDYDPPSTR